MILLATVAHSGTHSLEDFLGDVELHDHCSPKLLDYIKTRHCPIAMTYRNPFRVAASWANRGQFERMDFIEQWTYWLKIKPMATVYRVEDLPVKLHTHADTLGVHKALDNKDWNTFYKHVPKDIMKTIKNLFQ